MGEIKANSSQPVPATHAKDMGDEKTRMMPRLPEKPEPAARAASASSRALPADGEIPAPQPRPSDRRPAVEPGKPELLAPAGGLEAFFAAMDYGADAVYLGLKKFSAREQAENFSIDDLDIAIGHAHEHGRKVYVTINTVIQQAEYDELIEMLAACEELGADAIIVQDFGVYRTIREYFPRLKWHGSTQMLVHNAEGARWLERNGFERVILARELTLNEIEEIRNTVKIQLETFVHGSLCYSYSGLCLFSSQETGRSGNRGKCAYTCRDTFKTPAGEGKAFSMKDLYAPTAVADLAKVGVRSLKIEGRRKSPLYVAAVTKLYRRMIDGESVDLKAAEQELKTIYSRETTKLFLDGSHGEHKSVADVTESEPQGVPLGRVDRVHEGRASFRALTEFERHDGILCKPRDKDRAAVKFGADKINFKGKRIFTVREGEDISIAAPDEVRPGDELRLIASQAIKRKYPTSVPAKLPRTRLKVHIDITVKVDSARGSLRELGMPGSLMITGRCQGMELKREYPVKLLFADSQPLDEKRLMEFFDRLGSTRFQLGTFNVVIPAGVFVPAAEINEARRQFFVAFDEMIAGERAKKIAQTRAVINQAPPATLVAPGSRRHAAMVDRVEYLDALPLDKLDEVIVDIANDRPEALVEAYQRHGHKLRIGVPIVVRAWEHAGVQWKLRDLYAAGARMFSVANVGGFEYIAHTAGIQKRKRMDTTQLVRRQVQTRSGYPIFEPKLPDFAGAGIDIAVDWPAYTLSREAARAWLEQGATRVTLSVEDGIKNMGAILGEFGQFAEVVVYQDTPLFVSESCVYANMLGHCPGRATCGFHEMDMTNSYGEKFLAVDHHCRTLIMGKESFSLSHRVSELEKAGAMRFRLDFVNRRYEGEEIRRVCESALGGKPVASTHEGNWARTLL